MRRAFVWHLTSFLAPCIFFCLHSKGLAQFSDLDLEFFENEIRPILVENCNECHSSEAEFLEGGLDVSSRISIVEGGDTGPAIIPNDAATSLLIQAVKYEGPYEMPPSTKLSPEKIKLLEEWVDRGAPWPPHDDQRQTIAKEVFDIESRKSQHWCWQPIQAIDAPTVDDGSWPLDDLDKFILRKLEENGVSPAPGCDRQTWIRRVYFDVIGLPPTREQIRAFVNDVSDSAYEKVIDGLLASPQFGERWARHWMDLFRYAETYGHEFDYPIQHAFQYRDYLIRAFNQDVPYNEFIREHVAGDLLPNPRLHPEQHYNESVIGTGFWFLGEATHAPVDVKNDEAGRIDNQIDVLCKTFLGMTVACARCHDHKFDAISTQDYYALAGYLQSSRRQLALLDPKQKIASTRKLAIDVAGKANQVMNDELNVFKRIKAETWQEFLTKSFGEMKDRPSAAKVRFDKIASLKQVENATHPFHSLRWLANEVEFLELQTKKFASDWEQQNQQYQAFIANSHLFEDFDDGIPQDWFLTGNVHYPTVTEVFCSATGNLVEHAGQFSSGSLGAKFQGVLRSPTFELTHDQIAVRVRGRASRIRLIIDGYVMDVHNPLLFNGCRQEVVQDNRFEWSVLKADVKNYKGHRAYLEFIDHGDGFLQVDEIRFLNRGSPRPVDPPSQLAQWTVEQKTGDRKMLIQSLASGLFRLLNEHPMDAEYCEVVSLIADHSNLGGGFKAYRQQIKRLEKGLPKPIKVIAMTEGTPEDEFLFIRGNSSTLGEKVPRRFLTALTKADSGETHETNGSGRLELADRIADPSNPLTTRVAVNRIWRHLTGRGIVKSVDNFGVLGAAPSHPELLDYLANEFAKQGWSVKGMIRRIALSRTYRMSSTVRPSIEASDPDNQWLHRARVRRLEGEAIRDSILKTAGSLNEKMYGPSVEIHLTDFMPGRGRPRNGGPLDGAGRRSLYIKIRRNFLSPMMLAFDTPIPFNTIGNRHQSNVPAQALILMNDPFVLQQAEIWAKKLIAESSTNAARVQVAFETALGRPPTQSEEQFFQEFVSIQAAELGLDEEAAGEDPVVWRDLCHVIFNMKEMVYIK